MLLLAPPLAILVVVVLLTGRFAEAASGECPAWRGERKAELGSVEETEAEAADREDEDREEE